MVVLYNYCNIQNSFCNTSTPCLRLSTQIQLFHTSRRRLYMPPRPQFTICIRSAYAVNGIMCQEQKVSNINNFILESHYLSWHSITRIITNYCTNLSRNTMVLHSKPFWWRIINNWYKHILVLLIQWRKCFKQFF